MTHFFTQMKTISTHHLVVENQSVTRVVVVLDDHVFADFYVSVVLREEFDGPLNTVVYHSCA